MTAHALRDGTGVDPGRDYTVVVNGFLAAGDGEFGAFGARRTGIAGTDIGGLPQPFVAPDPVKNPRVTLVR